MLSTHRLTISATEDFQFSNLEANAQYFITFEVPSNALGQPWQIPIMVLKGKKSGPTLGITSAIHGNELNGVFTIYEATQSVKVKDLSGTLVCCPLWNVPGFIFKQRTFPDAQDLNRCMPGQLDASKPSGLYNYYLAQKIVKQFDYLLDLHTASVGNTNSLYIRADLKDPKCKELAYWQNPHIIVQKYDAEGTLRSWANSIGIPAITIEIGNPHAFQPDLVNETLDGIFNTLVGLKMIEGQVQNFVKNTHICSSSFWLYSSVGGLLKVLPKLTDRVVKGQVIAEIVNMFGETVKTIKSEHDGIVIGKATTPYCEPGSRMVHIGLFD